MRQLDIRIAVALIVLFGHLLVFLFGFIFIGVLSASFNSDTLQVILMASPVLAATAIAALKYILGEETTRARGALVSRAFAFTVIAVPVLLIALIFLLFLITYYRLNGFGIDALKVSLGTVETCFAAFLTSISKKLFGAAKAA